MELDEVVEPFGNLLADRRSAGPMALLGTTRYHGEKKVQRVDNKSLKDFTMTENEGNENLLGTGIFDQSDSLVARLDLILHRLSHRPHIGAQ